MPTLTYREPSVASSGQLSTERSGNYQQVREHTWSWYFSSQDKNMKRLSTGYNNCGTPKERISDTYRTIPWTEAQAGHRSVQAIIYAGTGTRRKTQVKSE